MCAWKCRSSLSPPPPSLAFIFNFFETPDQGDGARVDRPQKLESRRNGSTQDFLRSPVAEGRSAGGDRAGHSLGEPRGHQRPGARRLGPAGGRVDSSRAVRLVPTSSFDCRFLLPVYVCVCMCVNECVFLLNYT